METFITTVFVIYVITIGIYLSRLAFKDYSQPEYKSWGGDMFNLVVILGFAIWTGILIF